MEMDPECGHPSCHMDECVIHKSFETRKAKL